MTLPLVLASSSRYRKAQLEQLQLPFETCSPEIDETVRPGESASALVQRLALEKARAVAARREAPALIIGSDQVAVLDEQILGKPGTHERALAQLCACQGRSVRFVTGLCLYNSATGQYQLEAIPFKVHFRTLDTAELERYLLREQPYQCAGSFMCEGLGISLFERLEGDDPNSLIGLPLIALVSMLRAEHYPVL